MPHSKSAQKQVRSDVGRQLKGKSVRSLCKTSVTKAEKLLFSGELESGRQAVEVAVSALDKAAEKKIVHPNNAARRKSRLMKKLNEAQALSADKSATE